MALFSVYSRATCQTLCHCFQFTAVPLATLYATVFSLQPCHLPDFMPLFSVYSRATCQTLCHCFQFTAVPLARLYATVFSLQPCHLPDFISLVPVYSRATGQTLFHWFQFTAVPLARLYFIGFSLHWSDFISLASVLTLVKLYFIVSACSPAACQTLLHWFQFTARPLTRLLHYYQFTTPPPVRLYCTSFSLQPGQLPHFIALVSVYSPATYQTIALLSVYNAATCQTLLHWFQFTAVPIATLYCIGFSLQSCHLSDFIPLVPVNNHTTGQTYSIGLSWQSRRLSDFISWFQFAVLPLSRFDFPCSVCNLLISAQRFIFRKVTMLFGYVPWAYDLMTLHCSSAISQSILHQAQGVT